MPELDSPQLDLSVSFTIRPSFKVAIAEVVLAEALLVGTFLLVSSMRAMYVRWLPGTTFPPESVKGMSFVLSSPLLLLFPYLASRKRSWVVGTEGVDIYRKGKIQRHVAWGEVASIEAWLMGAIIRHSGSTRLGEQLAPVSIQESRRLRQLWCQIHPQSRPKEIPPRHLIRILLACGVLALLGIPLFLAFPHPSVVRSLCWGWGTLLAIYGTGIGIWSTVRVRSLRLLISTLPVALALGGWIWIMINGFPGVLRR